MNTNTKYKVGQVVRFIKDPNFKIKIGKVYNDKIISQDGLICAALSEIELDIT